MKFIDLSDLHPSRGYSGEPYRTIHLSPDPSPSIPSGLHSSPLWLASTLQRQPTSSSTLILPSSPFNGRHRRATSKRTLGFLFMGLYCFGLLFFLLRPIYESCSPTPLLNWTRFAFSNNLLSPWHKLTLYVIWNCRILFSSFVKFPSLWLSEYINQVQAPYVPTPPSKTLSPNQHQLFSRLKLMSDLLLLCQTDYKLCVEFLNLHGRGLHVREDPPVLLRFYTYSLRILVIALSKVLRYEYKILNEFRLMILNTSDESFVGDFGSLSNDHSLSVPKSFLNTLYKQPLLESKPVTAKPYILPFVLTSSLTIAPAIQEAKDISSTSLESLVIVTISKSFDLIEEVSMTHHEVACGLLLNCFGLRFSMAYSIYLTFGVSLCLLKYNLLPFMFEDLVNITLEGFN